MEITTIIELVGSVLFSSGLLEFIKWLYNRHSEKNATELENVAKAQELLEHKNGTVEEWEKLNTMHQEDLAYYRACVTDKDARIDEKERLIEDKQDKIEELKKEINDLTSENTALRLTRCEKLACPDRVPPFGFSKIDIKNGKLEEDR